MHRILSEEKKEKFISSAENIDYTKVSPNDVLKAQDLSDRLKKENIQVEYLYKTGCPYQYIDDSKKLCGEKNPQASYCNICAECWLYNLTDEVGENNKKNTLLDEYLDTGLSPTQIKEILSIFDWDKLNDFEMLKEVIYEVIDKMREE